MPTPPVLLPTRIDEGHGPGVMYRIQGDLVPVLHIRVDGSMPIYFEHHVILWKDPALNLGVKAMAGGIKRMVAGMPLHPESAGRL